MNSQQLDVTLLEPDSALLPLPVDFDPVGVQIDKLAHQNNQRGWLFGGAMGALWLLTALALVVVASRPARIIWLKVDALGLATPVAYADLRFTPEAKMARAYLTQWVTASYQKEKDTVATTYRKRFFFMSHEEIVKAQANDKRTGEIAGIENGSLASNTLDINSEQITSFNAHPGEELAADGTAQVTFTKHFYTPGSAKPGQLQHFVTTVKWTLSPNTNPQLPPALLKEYQDINPVGFTVVWVSESATDLLAPESVVVPQ